VSDVAGTPAGEVNPCAVQEFFNRKYLYARKFAFVHPFRAVESNLARLASHLPCRRVQRYQYADFRFLTVDNSAQIPNVRALHMPALDGYHDFLFCTRGTFRLEKQYAVDSPVRSLLLLERTRTDKPQSPILKLVLIRIRKRFRSSQIDRFADNLVLRLVAIRRK